MWNLILQIIKFDIFQVFVFMLIVCVVVLNISFYFEGKDAPKIQKEDHERP